MIVQKCPIAGFDIARSIGNSRGGFPVVTYVRVLLWNGDHACPTEPIGFVSNPTSRLDDAERMMNDDLDRE